MDGFGLVLFLCEVLLWIILFILLLLALRALMKACYPNRAIFRSETDDERKRRDVEEDEMEEEDDEEDEGMMKATVNGQSGISLANTEWTIQSVTATRNAPPRPTPVLAVEAPAEGVEGGRGDVEEEAPGNGRRRSCKPRKPGNRRAVEAMLVTLFAILVGYFFMMGILTLVYYLFEYDFLYGQAVTCPAMANSECVNDGEDFPCCDYSFDYEGLVREARFVGVTGSGASKEIAARLHLWLVRADPSGEFYDVNRPKYLIFTHGNIDNLTFYKKLFGFLAKDLGLNVVAWDYPGFGESRGKPSEDLIHESMAAVFQWLVDEERVERKDMILWGYSLGGEVTTKLANRYPGIMGVILQAPIDSSLAVIRATLPLTGWAFISAITQPYNTGAEIERLKSCLFLVVGASDENMEPYRMQRLFRRAYQTNPSCRKYFEIPSLGHLSNPLESHEFKLQLRLYLTRIINLSN